MQLRYTEGEESTFTAGLLPVLKVTNYIHPEKYPGKTVVSPVVLAHPAKCVGAEEVQQNWTVLSDSFSNIVFCLFFRVFLFHPLCKWTPCAG